MKLNCKSCGIDTKLNKFGFCSMECLSQYKGVINNMIKKELKKEEPKVKVAKKKAKKIKKK